MRHKRATGIRVMHSCAAALAAAMWLGAEAPGQAGQCQIEKLLASDGAADDFFGGSVSVSGDVAVVGAYGDDDNGTYAGSAYVFRFNGSTWVQEQKLLASDGAAGDRFGLSVSVSSAPGGEVAAVGAHANSILGPGSGSAYIYRFTGSAWVQEQRLLASDGAAGGRFGLGVSVSGDVAVVGAYLDNATATDSGSAYVYRFNGSVWVPEQKLTAADGAAFDLFGLSVSVSGAPGGEVAVVGAYFNNDSGLDSGSAYIYRFDGSTWEQEQKLTAADGAASDRFGVSVSVSADVAVVGAYLDDDNGNNSGSAYIYRFNGSAWVQEQKLTAADGAAGDEFGWSVSIGGDIAMVGARKHDDNETNSGSVYIYRFNGSVWMQEQELFALDGVAGDRFGNSVSVGSSVAVVGADGVDDYGSESGSAYVFNISNACPFDLNDDGIVDFHDLVILIQRGDFTPDDVRALLDSRGPCPAPGNCDCPHDFNGDGVVNVSDLLLLIRSERGGFDVIDLLALLAAWGACP